MRNPNLNSLSIRKMTHSHLLGLPRPTNLGIDVDSLLCNDTPAQARCPRPRIGRNGLEKAELPLGFFNLALHTYEC